MDKDKQNGSPEDSPMATLGCAKLTAKVYDAVEKGKKSISDVLAEGFDPNGSARCRRSGMFPAPLWRAALLAGKGRTDLDVLAAAGCRFVGGAAARGQAQSDGAVLAVACTEAGADQIEWYVEGARSGLLPVPQGNVELESVAIVFGELAERMSMGDRQGEDFQEGLNGVLHAFARWAQGMKPKMGQLSTGRLEDANETGSTASERCASIARELAKLGVKPTEKMLLRAIRVGLPAGVLAAIEAVGVEPEVAERTRTLMHKVIDAMPSDGGFDMVREAEWSSPSGAREEWRRAKESGEALARAGMRLDLEASARSGSPFIVGAALGSGSVPSSRGDELALLVAAMADQHEPEVNRVARALMGLMGPSKTPALGALAVLALSNLGCLLAKDFKWSDGFSSVKSAQSSARRVAKYESKVAAKSMFGSPIGNLGAAVADPDLPASIEEFARFVLTLSECELLAKACPANSASRRGSRRM